MGINLLFPVNRRQPTNISYLFQLYKEGSL